MFEDSAFHETLNLTRFLGVTQFPLIPKIWLIQLSAVSDTAVNKSSKEYQTSRSKNKWYCSSISVYLKSIFD